MKRLGLILLLVCSQLVFITPAGAQGTTCSPIDGQVSICRIYTNTNQGSSRGPFSFWFTATAFRSESSAARMVDQAAGIFESTPPSGTVSATTTYEFGESQVTFAYKLNKSMPAGPVVNAGLIFQEGSVVHSWLAMSVGSDPFENLHDVYEKLEAQEADDENRTLLAYSRLPKEDILPQGFSESSEAYSDDFDMSLVAASSLQDTPAGGSLTLPAPGSSSGERSSRSSTSSTRSSNDDPLEILSITPKDAGIGDGTIYVYVEVVNNTAQLYPYVGLEGTCYSAEGDVLGTGMGNTANVASGETVVVTMIFLSVPGCDNVKVRFDGLTG